MARVSGVPKCPSSRPEEAGARIIGIVNGTVADPRVGYLEESIPVTPEILSLSAPVSPTEVFRFSAPCRQHGCPQFEGGNCQLAVRVVRALPTVVDSLPRCSLRPECRWWRQEGREACLRCPSVVTDSYSPSPVMRYVAGTVGCTDSRSQARPG